MMDQIHLSFMVYYTVWKEYIKMIQNEEEKERIEKRLFIVYSEIEEESQRERERGRGI